MKLLEKCGHINTTSVKYLNSTYIFGYRKGEKVGTKMIINLPVIRNL